MQEDPEDNDDKELRSVLDEAGRKHKKRRSLRTALNTVVQSVFGTSMTLGRLGLDSVAKYFLSAVQIPLEIINLIAQIKNLIDKEKSAASIALVLFVGLGTIAFMALSDAFRFGSSNVFIKAVVAHTPIVFTVVLSLYATLNAISFIASAVRLIKNPERATPLRKFSLVSKAVKTAGLILLASLIIPFMGALVANPVGATIFLSVIAATLITLTAMKFVKTWRENTAWKKTISELDQCDPYDKLFTPEERYEFDTTLAEEAKTKNQKNFFQKFSDLFKKDKTIGSAELLDAALKNRVSEIKLKEISHQDKQTQILAMQQIYDLLRKPRGRLKYEEARAKQLEKPEVLPTHSDDVDDAETMPHGPIHFFAPLPEHEHLFKNKIKEEESEGEGEHQGEGSVEKDPLYTGNLPPGKF